MNRKRKAAEKEETAAAAATEPAGETTVTAPEQPKPNIVFVGRRSVLDHATGKQKLVDKDIPKFMMFPRLRIDLPKGLEHGQPFYSEHAARLIQSSPDFKDFVKKGDK